MSVQFSVDIAEFTRALQSQNGLRHGDYSRDRQFCGRKLHRVRTSLKMTNGRNKFRMAVLPEKITSPRFLQLFILQAERCWAHALILKADYAVGDGCNQRIKHHYIRKFYKAARWSVQLADLAELCGDSQTVSEARAYSRWLTGLALTEAGKYEAALVKLTECSALYNDLLSIAVDEAINPNQARAYRHRISDLEPIIRLCNYKLRLMAVDPTSPRSSVNYESANEMELEGEVEFASSDSEMELDADEEGKRRGDGFMSKVTGWWSR